MSKQTEYVAGWIDTTIHDFLLGIARPASNMAYALITCVDSSFDIGVLQERSPQLGNLRGKGQLVGQGLMLKTRALLNAERHQRIFFGFDEVWFFPKAEITPKPEHWVITGPDLIDPREIEQYGDWMRSNGCSLGLGDGTGMNCCVPARGVVKHVVAALAEARLHSLDESPPS